MLYNLGDYESRDRAHIADLSNGLSLKPTTNRSKWKVNNHSIKISVTQPYKCQHKQPYHRNKSVGHDMLNVLNVLNFLLSDVMMLYNDYIDHTDVKLLNK